ncbi:MAG: hypothetical protein GY865_20455 [candidate division Zixibacteria bacterium]|nr:hypothetical protein [candidate division Zixibacteria bacterium]
MVLLLLLFGVMASAQDLPLAIVYTDSLKSTMRTMRGIKSSISKQQNSITFHDYLLTSNKSVIEQRVSEINEINPRLIITIGSFATQEISSRIKNKPIIFSAVLNPETSGFVKSKSQPGGRITGASLDIPPDIQYTYFKRVISDLKKIGVLYSDETANLIPPAKAVASEAGLELIAVKIDSEKDIPSALEKLGRMTDGIWSVADKKIYSPRSTRFILLNTLRNGIPFMGFSRNLVESGALFALDFDYKDIGRQTGKIVLKVLAGRDPARIKVEVPGIIWFHYNEKTANHINIDVPEDLIAIAKEVHR